MIHKNTDQKLINILGEDIDGENLENIKKAFSILQKRGVIMDVTSVEQAKIAEKAGAVSVMVLDQLPSDLVGKDYVKRTAKPEVIKDIMEAIDIPVMAKCRIGHTGEARMLEAIGVDMIDESEVLTPADTHHIDKKKYQIPFVCGAVDVSSALRRIFEGATMIRTKGLPGTGNIIEAVKHSRNLQRGINSLINARNDKKFLDFYCRTNGIPQCLVEEVIALKRLPVVNFAAGGIVNAADAALMMSLGMDGVFVGSGIFSSGNSYRRAKAIVNAVSFYGSSNYWEKIAENTENTGKDMGGMAYPPSIIKNYASNASSDDFIYDELLSNQNTLPEYKKYIEIE